jgi:hypothetical protein
MLAAVRLNVWVWNLRPPRKALRPKTMSVLPMIEPVIDALTRSERRVQQAAHPRPVVLGQLLGGQSENPRQRDDGQRGSDEDGGPAGMEPVLQNERDREEDQQ